MATRFYLCKQVQCGSFAVGSFVLPRSLSIKIAEDRRMLSRPKGSLSRILLVACAVGLGSSSLYGQSSTPPSAPAAPPISRIDIFMGYSYLAPHGTIYTPVFSGGTIPDTYSSVD